MHDKPRRDGDSIITRKMMKFIVGSGTLFAVLMLGMFCYLLFVNHSLDEGCSHITSHIMPDEVAIYFTTFVFLQFWNMFNAKAFDSGHSAFHNIKDSKVFFSIAAIILIGQIVIVQVGYKMFQIEPLTLKQWVLIFFGTSPVMLIGEFIRKIKKQA
jgi:Ca2+-transporting ATPase